MKTKNLTLMILLLSLSLVSCSKKKESTSLTNAANCSTVGCTNGTVTYNNINSIEGLEQAFQDKKTREDGQFPAGTYEAILYDSGLGSNGSIAYRRYSVTSSQASWMDYSRSWKLKNLLPRIELDLPGLVEWSSHDADDHLGNVIAGTQGSYNYEERIGQVLAKAKASQNTRISSSTLQVGDANGRQVQIRVTYIVDMDAQMAFGFSPDVPIWANPVYLEIGGFNPRIKKVQAFKKVR